MIPVSLKSALLALCGLFLLNCRTTQTAYFQPNAPTFIAEPVPKTESLAEPERMPAPAITAEPEPVAVPGEPVASPVQVRHQNPDAGPPRRHTWFQQARLYGATGESYTAPRLMTKVSTTKRAVPKGAVYALAGSVLPYGLLLTSSLPAWAWLLSLSLPVASLFMAAGALAKIRRNKEQFRGKGVAVAAMLLATSYMGIVLYAVAALATSGILWE